VKNFISFSDRANDATDISSMHAASGGGLYHENQKVFLNVS